MLGLVNVRLGLGFPQLDVVIGVPAAVGDSDRLQYLKPLQLLHRLLVPSNHHTCCYVFQYQRGC